MARNFDLNAPPMESELLDNASASGINTTINQQVNLSQSNSGVFSSPVDVVVIEDDDVPLLSAPTQFPQRMNQAIIYHPMAVVVDANMYSYQYTSLMIGNVGSYPAPYPLQSGVTDLMVEDPLTTLSLGSRDSREGISTNGKVICSKFCINLEEDHNAQREMTTNVAAVSPTSPPPPPPPKEPTFGCPVCMSELTAACSTICGHIFCEDCITQSIKANKKCPLCQTKLTTKRKFHRIYLPSTTN